MDKSSIITMESLMKRSLKIQCCLTDCFQLPTP